MRLSRYFLPTLPRTAARGRDVSHRLMLRARHDAAEAAGIYAFLPLGFRVLQKMPNCPRGAETASGAIRIADADNPVGACGRRATLRGLWQEMLRIKDRTSATCSMARPTKKWITEIFRASVRSYKDLPLNLYHIQWKFRDEVRPRFGLMRGREFLIRMLIRFDVDSGRRQHSYTKCSWPICAPSSGWD